MLDTLFHRGMRGTGEHYSSLIFQVVEETQLTSEQVKVGLLKLLLPLLTTVTLWKEHTEGLKRRLSSMEVNIFMFLDVKCDHLSHERNWIN